MGGAGRGMIQEPQTHRRGSGWVRPMPGPRALQGPPSHPIFNGERSNPLCVRAWRGLSVLADATAAGRRAAGAQPTEFIYPSALMHELPERSLKAVGWGIPGPWHHRQGPGRAAGTAVTRRHHGLLGGRPAPATLTLGTALGGGGEEGAHMWKVPLCPSLSVPFALPTALPCATGHCAVHRHLCCAAGPGRRAPDHEPFFTDGETAAGGLSDGARVWPGCLKMMAPGTGRHGPRLAGEGTEASRTSVKQR